MNLITYMLRNHHTGEYAEQTMPRSGFDPGDGVWVIGDVHGCIRTLEVLLQKLPKDANFCFVGDLIDRGPESARVVELVEGMGWDCVMGNHELVLLGWLGATKDALPLWDKFPEHFTWTVDQARQSIYSSLKPYPDWFSNLPLYIHYPVIDEKGQELLVSHSSLNIRLTLEKSVQDLWLPDSLLWNRWPWKVFPGFYHVFGHTPQGMLPTISKSWAAIDTGCIYLRKDKKKSRLTAIHFPSKTVVQQENLDTQ